MKKLTCTILCSLVILCACAPAAPAATATPASTSTQAGAPTGPYLGQPLPAAEPLNFAAALLTGGYHSSPTFTPDGSEMYWGATYANQAIYFIKQTDGVWGRQQRLSLPGGFNQMRDPFVSPDGTRLYFISTAALPGAAAGGKENIWVAQREGDAWGTPQPLPDAINALQLHWTISVAANGNLYFTSGPNGIGDLYLSRFVDGAYSAPELLPAPLNDPAKLEITPNIAPDESYILFSRSDTTKDTPRLYISYATAAGWSEPALVENVPGCVSPIVTPDRSYVFCMPDPSQLQWRDTSFIEELRPG
jgi:Tol biopolymer transport system component